MTRTHAYVYAGFSTLELAALFHFMSAGHEAEAIIAFTAAGLHAVLAGDRPNQVQRTGCGAGFDPAPRRV